MKKFLLLINVLLSLFTFSQQRSADGFMVAVSGVQVKGVPFEINSKVYTRKEIRGTAVLTDKSGASYERRFLWKVLNGYGILEVAENDTIQQLTYDQKSQTFTYLGHDYELRGNRQVLLQGLLAYAKGNKREKILKEINLEKIARGHFDTYFASAYGVKAAYTLGLSINTLKERLAVLPDDIALSKREDTGYSHEERRRIKERAAAERSVLKAAFGPVSKDRRSAVDLYSFFTVLTVPSSAKDNFTSSFRLTLDEEGRPVLPPRDVVL